VPLFQVLIFRQKGVHQSLMCHVTEVCHLPPRFQLKQKFLS
jgi:hypothetical protein